MLGAMLSYEKAKGMIANISKIPYPQVTNVYPNERLANLLFDSYAGMQGELTAITQYIYEHMEFSKEKDASLILRMIAIEEMKHLGMVGDLLKQLGKKPVYQVEKKDWSAHNVRYTESNFKQVLSYNIQAEDAAIYGYRRAMMATKNVSIRRLLDRIILDERTHKEIFQKMMN